MPKSWTTRAQEWTIAVGRRVDIVGLGGLILIAFLGTLVALLVVGFVPLLGSANRDVAIGDVFGGGIFLLAFIAAGVSLFAYAQSSRRPRLTTTWSFWLVRDRLEYLGEEDVQFPIDLGARPPFSRPLPPDVDDARELVPLEPVQLRTTITNFGEVSGKYVTVAFFLEGIYFDPDPN